MNCKKIVAMLALLCSLAYNGNAQTEINTDFISQMNNAFAPLFFN